MDNENIKKEVCYKGELKRKCIYRPVRARGASASRVHPLGDYIKSFPTKISGGQQQRCAIERALVTGADLILADEPTGALDSKTGQEIIDLLQEINNEGKTVIIVTHDERIASQTKKIIRLADGKIIES